MNSGMSHEDRRWLEGRMRDMEARITLQITEYRDVATTRLNDHSRRIRALENWRSWIAGLSAAAGAAGGWVVQLFRD